MNAPTPRQRKIIFINSHPIQYFAPLYKYLNEHDLPTECWYCSDENVKGHVDRQFGAKVEWDVPLLEGYRYRFFRNLSWRPSLYSGFFGLINPGLILALFREPKSVVIVHGWSYLTHILVVIFGRFAGHTVCLRGESPLNQELMKSSTNRIFKRIVLQGFIFQLIQRFLFIGSQNQAFYKYYGVSDSRLLFVPYSVDNDRFRKAATELLPTRIQLQAELNLPPSSKIILFTAKFTPKKRPLDLLEAFDKLERTDKLLVMVGEGKLRPAIEEYIRDRGLRNVYLTGFVNQKDIVKYYAIADVFVLCSGEGETWGLATNEALNFDVPIVIADRVGCSFDLVNSKTGLVSETGNVENLRNQIDKALNLGRVDSSILETYSFATIAHSLKRLLHNDSPAETKFDLR